MKQQIEAKATAQAINVFHQIHIVEEMNVCRGYNGMSVGKSKQETHQEMR